MESIEVLVLPQVPDEVLHRIQNIDRRVKIIDARGWFDIELRATWPQWTVEAVSRSQDVSRDQPRRAQPRSGLGADRAHGLATTEGFKGARAALEMGP